MNREEFPLLHMIRETLSVDFVAIANVLEDNKKLLTYTCASGNLNHHYQGIVLEKGRGLIGRVYQEEKSIILLLTEEDRKNPILVNYPIILAENLKNVMAVPLWKDACIKAIVVLGYRIDGDISEEFCQKALKLLKETFREYTVKEEKCEDMISHNLECTFEPVPIYELMSTPIANARQEERRLIARDLHDNVLQNVVGVKWLLNSVRHAETDKLADSVLEIEEYLDCIQEELRNFSVLLRTTVEEDRSLSKLLKDQIDMLKKISGMNISFHQNVEDKRFGNKTELSVLRISQEAIYNAYKYSGTDDIDVSLMYTEKDIPESLGLLTLTVEDRGTGFEWEKVKEKEGNMGINNMEEWADFSGGNLVIQSSPGKGTKITFSRKIL